MVSFLQQCRLQRGLCFCFLIFSFRKQGWLWTEEYIWHKKNCFPGKWPNRFRDAWERCLHFTKSKKFAMYQKAVRVPMGDWADTRLKNLSDTDKLRDESKVNSGFGKKVDNWIGRELAYPTNVLHLADRDKESVDIPEELQDRIIKLLADLSYPTNVLHFATECGNKNHSAAFPENLPEWFIKLFTRKNGFVPQQSPPTVAATPSDTIVWVNIPTHIYHYPGSRYYGSTLNGKYMKEEDAINEGDRAGHSIYDRRNLQKK